MRRHTVLALLAAAAIPTLLAGCATLTEGPLTLNQGSKSCVPASLYPVIAVGFGGDIDRASRVKIVAVEPINPGGLSVDNVWIVPFTENLRAGVEAFPPSGDRAGAWSDAVPAVGATIGVDQTVDFVAEVSHAGTGDGRLEGLRVQYTTGGRTYFAESPQVLVYAEGDCADLDL